MSQWWFDVNLRLPKGWKTVKPCVIGRYHDQCSEYNTQVLSFKCLVNWWNIQNKLEDFFYKLTLSSKFQGTTERRGCLKRKG